MWINRNAIFALGSFLNTERENTANFKNLGNSLHNSQMMKTFLGDFRNKSNIITLPTKSDKTVIYLAFTMC